MRTITLDILNDKALSLLKDLEMLEVIRVRRSKAPSGSPENLISKYKGAMTAQPVDEIEQQLNDLRNEWQ